MLEGATVILVLKVAVTLVTLLLGLSVLALLLGKRKLHGRINWVVFVLTVLALVGLEVIVRILQPGIFEEYFGPDKTRLYVHLCFSLPSAGLLPVMLYTGTTRRGTVHRVLAALFAAVWTGTFVTGVFFL